LDGSWRLDRKNGENRSLNNTDIRRALIDSRYHQDEESAIACCYDSSLFNKETSEEKSLDTTQELTPKPEIKKKRKAPTIPEQSNKETSEEKSLDITQELASKPRIKKKRKAPAIPKESKTTNNKESSLDASWCLDRSDGTNRTLNQSEIEDKKPSAPVPIYPQLPINPFFKRNPPPMPVNTLPPNTSLGGIWIDDTPNQGELKREEEEEMMYNHQLEPIKFKELDGLLTIGEQKAKKENKQ